MGYLQLIGNYFLLIAWYVAIALLVFVIPFVSIQIFSGNYLSDKILDKIERIIAFIIAGRTIFVIIGGILLAI